MTKFLDKSFSVYSGTGDEYRDNWERTFGNGSSAVKVGQDAPPAAHPPPAAPAPASDEAEQLRVQLAGCGVAAMGGIGSRCQVANRGDYGWSQSYQDVVDLRTKYQKLLAEYQKIGRWAMSGVWEETTEPDLRQQRRDAIARAERAEATAAPDASPTVDQAVATLTARVEALEARADARDEIDEVDAEAMLDVKDWPAPAAPPPPAEAESCQECRSIGILHVRTGDRTKTCPTYLGYTNAPPAAPAPASDDYEARARAWADRVRVGRRDPLVASVAALLRTVADEARREERAACEAVYRAALADSEKGDAPGTCNSFRGVFTCEHCGLPKGAHRG